MSISFTSAVPANAPNGTVVGQLFNYAADGKTVIPSTFTISGGPFSISTDGNNNVIYQGGGLAGMTYALTATGTPIVTPATLALSVLVEPNLPAP